VTRLVLCRHAEVGHPEQASALADALATFRFDAVYTSPLPRALETARAIADVQSLAPVEVDELREIDFGEVDGLGFDDLPPDLQAGLLRDPLSVRFPGGETYTEVQRRVCAALDRIVSDHPGDTLAVITHAGPIRAAFAQWLHVADEAVFRIDQRFAAVNIVEWIDGVPIVRLVNG
jgi:broad specificity phosphatase PhoE